MMPRFIDLSAPIQTSIDGVAPRQRTEIAFETHAEGAAAIQGLFGIGPELLRDGEGWATERLILGTHNSTHVDAPFHYNSRIAGEPAETIDQLPLERFFAPGVVLDFSDRADGASVTATDLRTALSRIEHRLTAGEIVLIRSDCDRFYGEVDYSDHGPGVTAEATRWLFEHGVRVMGIDAWGWDRPLGQQAADARQRNRPGIFWEAHLVDLPYSQIERLCNLAALPPDGFTVACFPLLIIGASAAPARVVAIVS
jgi:kynurenine formamidase